MVFTKNGRGGYKLSDDGYVLSELGMLGIDIFSSPKRKSFFDMTLRMFSVENNRATGELSLSIICYPIIQKSRITSSNVF
ncbi:DUF1828 domain-containing protein [Sporosarcina luteola]|uniref:DUF1828 domain-containing protein n=1 Tax=Sporosarcina luteola TaxID=582850 RepID=UPI0033411C4B